MVKKSGGGEKGEGEGDGGNRIEEVRSDLD